jgi:hypothetical protein
MRAGDSNSGLGGCWVVLCHLLEVEGTSCLKPRRSTFPKKTHCQALSVSGVSPEESIIAPACGPRSGLDQCTSGALSAQGSTATVGDNTGKRMGSPAGHGGSLAETPNNKLDISRVTATDAARPSATPASSSLTLGRNASRRMSLGRAPCATRSPNFCRGTGPLRGRRRRRPRSPYRSGIIGNNTYEARLAP